MTDYKPANRIPAEDAADYRSWHLPLIDDNGKVLSSAEKEARDRAQAKVRQQAEKVEEAELDQGSSAGISAQELGAIVEQAEKEGFEQGREAGFEKGQAEGYEAGQQQGLMEMRQQLVAEQQRFAQLAEALLKPLQEQDDDLEKVLVDTLCTLTRSVVQRELQTDSGEIVSLVRHAIDALPAGADNLQITLNPDDLASVEDYAEEHKLEWRFSANADMLPGGCEVRSAISRVDYSAERRLAEVLEQFANKQFSLPESDTQDAESDAEENP
ncbi:flagellar assembly protein FliH [Marinimicrobium alkaliphilum]|uniref:flagellar assembly protein FliH n=1 Tax=Marinimicrobium alkaliphilum TaxID=2202654 RepID=UPI000DB9FB6F|nr:flagellar assembly protein FliH [Marinimicrobium alkaliphilum]